MLVLNSVTINNGTFRHMITWGITGRSSYSSSTGNAIGNAVNGGSVVHGQGGGFRIVGTTKSVSNLVQRGLRLYYGFDVNIINT